LVEQLRQLFQFIVTGIQLQPVFHLLFRQGDVVGNIELRAAVEKIISGQKLRAGVCGGVTISSMAFTFLV
jgi:hypothetical protein